MALGTAAHAGTFDDPVQDCDPDAGNPTTGRWYQNGEPGETNNVVAGFRREGDEYRVYSEDNATGSGGEPVVRVISCTSADTRWRLFLSHLGDRADSARVDAAGLSGGSTPRGGTATPLGPLPARIEARLFGGGGPDDLLGHDGKNILKGGKGEDELRSFGRNDLLVGGPQRDLIAAGDGADLIRAVDGVRDRINCGAGEDVAKVDRRDAVSGCETVRFG